MKTVGLFEAKTKLSELCSEVAQGGRPVLITKRGVPWVRIEPAEKRDGMTIRERRAEYMVKFGRQEKKDIEDFSPTKRSSDKPRGAKLD
jgi:prevent-host-death family protein